MNKKIKLSLLGTLIAGSALAVTLPIVSCSASNNNNDNTLLVDETSLKSANIAAQNTLKGIIGTATTSAEQNAILETWIIGSEVSLDLSNAIKNALQFTNNSNEKISGDLAIEKVTYLTEVQIGVTGESILGPKLEIILKSEYTISSQLFLEPGQIGIVK